MDNEEKNIRKLQRLMNLMDDDALTREEFAKAFEAVVNFVKKIEQDNIKAVEMMNDALNKLSDKVKNDADSKTEMSKKEMMDYCMKEMEGMMKSHEEKMMQMDKRMSELKDGEPGEDADEEKIVETVMERLLDPVTERVGQNLPTLATAVRDSLELLQGDERLDVNAIKGLQEMIDEIKNRKVGGGGGFSSMAMNIHIVDDETPVGDINGVNTVFTIAHAPNPVSSLKVYLNGQRLRITEDYTLSGNTITLLVAPDTGGVLLVDYRL